MSFPKVLVGCPTYESYRYCIKEYLEAVKSFTYPNYNLLLVDNSPTDVFATELKKEGIDVRRIPWHEDVAQRIEKSRNILREEVLRGYDCFLSLEQDVIPPKDVIERLLRHNADFVSGIYYYPATINIHDKNGVVVKTKKMLTPLVAKPYAPNHDFALPCSPADVEEDKVFPIRSSGLGCVLIRKKVLENIRFRFKTLDDAQNFSNDCWKARFTMIVDTSVKCKHLIKNKPLWVSALLQPKILGLNSPAANITKT